MLVMKEVLNGLEVSPALVTCKKGWGMEQTIKQSVSVQCYRK